MINSLKFKGFGLSLHSALNWEHEEELLWLRKKLREDGCDESEFEREKREEHNKKHWNIYY